MAKRLKSKFGIEPARPPAHPDRRCRAGRVKRSKHAAAAMAKHVEELRTAPARRLAALHQETAVRRANKRIRDEWRRTQKPVFEI